MLLIQTWQSQQQKIVTLRLGGKHTTTVCTRCTYFREHFFKNWQFAVVKHSLEIMESCVLYDNGNNIQMHYIISFNHYGIVSELCS